MRASARSAFPGGIFSWARPSIVGTSILAPNALSGTVTGLNLDIIPGTDDNRMAADLDRQVKIACRAAVDSALPLPASRILCPSRVPGLMRTSTSLYGTPFLHTAGRTVMGLLTRSATLRHSILNFMRRPSG